jgi:hypothetical protein
MAGSSSRARRLPLLLVGVAVGFNLWTLRAEMVDVWYLNDAGIHQSMVRWAAMRIREGHLPFDGWYPYLSLGASRFHHYQSLPHILTGALSTMTGPGTFRWSLYLLLCTWPIAVYCGGRLFDLDPWAAGVAALVSPLIVSAPALGFEWSSYVWRGSGTWAQLWGMWALPFAWGLSWRAVSKGRPIALAALVLGITVCLHLLIGYLALLSLGVWVLLSPGDFWRRAGRAALLGLGALATASWMLVPLITDAKWMTQDEFSRGTYFYDSFGARRVLGWLITGRIFDNGRVPVVSVLALIGLAVCAWRFRRSEAARAVPAVGLLSLLLFFGRPTLGLVIDLLPGGTDLFLRRYVTGVHLAGIYLAGIGGAWVGGKAMHVVRTRAMWLRPVHAAAALAIVLVVVVAPAAVDRYAFERKGAEWISEQQVVQSTEGADFASLVATAKAAAPGRIYSGMRANRSSPKIGFVPAYAALVNLDADAVGFTRPTWSLMANVENRFAAHVAAQVDMFGVRWAILPEGDTPPAGSLQAGVAGRWVLWSTGDIGYLSLVDTVTPVTVDRTDLGLRMAAFLSSDLPLKGRYPTLAFGGVAGADPTLDAGDDPTTPPGSVGSAFSQPADGRFGGEVQADRSAVVQLKASFDPRWTVTVDGVDTPTEMIAPGFVGVRVTPGHHRVLFVYHAYPFYWALFASGAIAMIALVLLERRFARRPVVHVVATPEPGIERASC